MGFQLRAMRYLSVRTSHICLMYLAFPILILVSSCEQSKKPDTVQTNATNETVQHLPKDSNDAVARMLEKWEDLGISSGIGADQHRTTLLIEARRLLGRGRYLGSFIEGLHERRESSAVDRLIENSKEEMFSGGNGAETRDWLLGVKDEALKKRLAFEAGYYFTGTGLKEYLDDLGQSGAQAEFLAGYCDRIAESDAERSLNEFRDLRPAGIDYSLVVDIVSRFPEATDFRKLGTRYGDDFTPSNALAKDIRRSLLKRWSSFRPKEAGEFVVANPKLVAVDQLDAVLMTWMVKSPDDAAGWVGGLTPGAHRDFGHEVLVRSFAVGNYALAWKYVGQVGDTDRMVKLATEVFKAWEKTDREAAEKAWVELFPAQ